MITLIQTDNGREISRHRTIETAARAQYRFDRAVTKANGRDSYVRTAIVGADGFAVDSHYHPHYGVYGEGC